MLFTFASLEDAWRRVSVASSEDIQESKYRYNLTINLYTLLSSIENETFTPMQLRPMKVKYPKPRIVQVPSKSDKIVQNDMCTRYLNQRSSVPLIKETCACIKGRGSDYAIRTVKSQLRHFYNVYHTNQFYILKCDVKSFFASIPHDKLGILVERYFDDEDVKKMVYRFIGLMEDRGLALGLPQSQLLANLYLSDVDHFCKENIRPDCYARYQDDYILVDRDRNKLEDAFMVLKEMVESKGLTFNPKTTIVRNNFDFIGFNFRVTETGKIVVRLSNSKKKQKRKHIKRMLERLRNGEIVVEKFADSYNGWRVHASKGDNKALIHSWDCWINKELKPLGYRLIFKKNKVRIDYVKKT